MLPAADELSTTKLYEASLEEANPRFPFTSSLYVGFVWPIPTYPPNSARYELPFTFALSNGIPEISFTAQIYPVDKLGLNYLQVLTYKLDRQFVQSLPLWVK